MEQAYLPALAGSSAFDDIDRHLALFMARHSEKHADLAGLTAALLSRELSRGHVCMELREFAGRAVDDDDPVLSSMVLPDAALWEACLAESGAAAGDDGFFPLVVERGRVYLHRYWTYEKIIAGELLGRVGAADITTGAGDDDLPARLFPDDGEGNLQFEAARMALAGKLCVISGGPGTGKTTTVAKILFLMLCEDPAMSIALAAPTGKAAARMAEAVDKARSVIENLISSGGTAGRGDMSRVLEAFSLIEGTTLHRLLGSRPGSIHFRHGRENPLHHDAVIIDEASMIDSALMAKFLQALKPGARLILLGDRDQLSSVEAGAVLADICGSALEREGLLKNNVIQLSRSWRFEKKAGIGRLSSAVRSGVTGKGLMNIFQEYGPREGIAFYDLPGERAMRGAIMKPVLENYGRYINEHDAMTALSMLNSYRILTPVKSGPWGVDGLNRLVESILEEAGLITRDGAFYINRPVMVRENDYSMGLFNGDMGIVREDESGRRRVYFPSTVPGQARIVMPSLLPAHETVYAMTVHKSQGSEFDRVLFVVPGKNYPIITRELIYTALTRARNLMEVMADREILSLGVSRRVSRASGLADRLV
ncbi:MAG: exodeoxyribonuclease V subunit alpha [Spirochaetae bacterium HGW-Spirochaetae-1]|jgi:exodeoxyribonuclease V alpha subunit|nr:MAG: exodeoxyribonuclease V subunit alpha [Spirochaetae bacterium HGW-Spirochaetae-1]